MPQCTAHSKRTKERCEANAMRGSNVCYHHGGKSLKGVASPSFKHGRSSRHIPARLLETYEQSLSDPELLTLRHETALVDARLDDLLSRVDEGEALTAWENARQKNTEIQKAVYDENYGRLMVLSAELENIVGSGMTDYAAWEQIRVLIEQRRKLVESEQKRLVAAQQMITTSEAMTLVVALIDIVKRHVIDHDKLAAISADVAKLTGPTSS